MNKFITGILTVLILISCKPNNDNNSSGTYLENTLVSHSHLVDSLNLENTSVSLSHLVDSLNLKKEDLRILIDKSEYKLSILADSRIIKEYPVVFGTNPIDDKLMEGDRSTPEGRFQIRDFYPHKSWSKFIWIDYPTKDSWNKHNKAKSENRIPDDATIGGEIGIHGVPNGKSSLIEGKVNWTWGCISLANKDVEDLYKIVYKKMKIEIVK